MVSYAGSLLTFIIAWVVSAVIIYAITKLFGEKEGILTALLAALIGSLIYAVVYAVLGQNLLGAVIAGIAWLVALQLLYNIGWLKSLLIAILIWIITAIIGWFLPTLTGPV